jgi:hypothetical protein
MNHALVAQTKANIDRLTPRLSIQPRSAMPTAKGRLTPSISHEINDTPFVVEKREGKTPRKRRVSLHLACFMHEGCRGGLRRDEIVAMVLMAA